MLFVIGVFLGFLWSFGQPDWPVVEPTHVFSVFVDVILAYAVESKAVFSEFVVEWTAVGRIDEDFSGQLRLDFIEAL